MKNIEMEFMIASFLIPRDGLVMHSILETIVLQQCIPNMASYSHHLRVLVKNPGIPEVKFKKEIGAKS